VINFRYHVVSLTAVFLALAIGLIVGTAALNGPAANDLHDRVNQLSKSNSQYRARVNSLTAEVKNKELFATELAPQLLAGTLADRRILVVSMPETASLVPQLDAMLGLSGAKITGHVEIEDSFVDPSNSSTLLSLALNSLDTAAISNLPNNSDGVETSAALLTAVLLDHEPAVTPASRTSVLSSYESDNYIKVDGGAEALTDPAESVVFLAPQPYADSNAATENQALVTIVTQLDAAGVPDAPGPLVVGAAGAAGSGNVIGAVTGDASLNKTVSTVDNADTPQGQIALVLAVNEQLVDKRAGHYGVSSSATSMLPKLVNG
jgi:hypothetical protein